MLFNRILLTIVNPKQFLCAERFKVNMAKSYTAAIEALNNLQSNADYIKQAKTKPEPEYNMVKMKIFLDRIDISLDQLDTLPIIHVTGTKGKGTTSSYCEAILRQHGYKTGFFSSPHLLEVRERIRINGLPISQELFTECFWNIYNKLDKLKTTSYDMPLYFRFLTLMAFQIFLSEKVEAVILEVGIGGEYDCTNLVRKTIAAGISSLDFDHTSLLGNTLESIAWNKAGIMKPGAQVFTVNQPDEVMKVFKDRSIEKHCSLQIAEDLFICNKTGIIPLHIQKANANLALALCKAFIKITNNNNVNKQAFDLHLAQKTIETTRWPGRYERITRNNSVFYLDGAHTPNSMKVCMDWYLSCLTDNQNKQKILIFNVIGDRNPEDLLNLLVKGKFNMAIFIPNIGDESGNSADTTDLRYMNGQIERCHRHKEIWSNLDPGCSAEVLSSVLKAVQYMERQDTVQQAVLVTGSIHLMGAAMSILDPTLGGIL